MTLLDRYVLRTLGINYVIALAIMMSLYTVLDLFFNIDEFTESGEPAMTIATSIISYYGAHAFLYFAQLSGVITLFACMVTLSRMRKANELTAVLSSGVSLYRLAVPIVAFGLVTSLLWYVDTEFFIPAVGHRLARNHEDAMGRRARGVWFVKDRDAALLSAMEFVPADGEMRQLLVLHRDEHGAIISVTEADRATWEPIVGHPAGGLWRLERGLESRRQMRGKGLGPREERTDQVVSTYESDLNPHDIEVRQARQWLAFSSSAQLTALAHSDPTIAGRARQIKHTRFASPLVHVLMLLLGLPFFLSREPANTITDAGGCLLVSGSCFLLAFSGEHIVRTSAWSALPAWLPLIVFAPVAVILLDRIRT